MQASSKPVLILGAGINGAALARELLLNRVPVCLVDVRDIASGTTACSSRLIHGGLRYLEYADFRLVRESLSERSRLLELAPQFVKPLRLYIPIECRATGMLQAGAKFFGLAGKWLGSGKQRPRGLWVVRIGLWFYDLLAKASTLPGHKTHRVGDSNVPPVSANRFRWMCSYFDAQIESPERFVVSLLTDALRLSRQHGIGFNVYTYHRATLQDGLVRVVPMAQPGTAEDRASDQAVAELEPAAIVNATGAWVDDALHTLQIPSRRLIGGTKGSHVFTKNTALRDNLNGAGIYAEATDGRPIFLLPFGDSTLIGTTDLPYDDPPEDAVPERDEIDYLLASTREIFPSIALTSDDVDLHYSGVRPLPYQSASTPGAITRRHLLVDHETSAVPIYSMVGGKLTTCRSFAEESTHVILERLGLNPEANSQSRFIPGGEDYPADQCAVAAEQQRMAETLGVPLDQVSAVWSLCGTRAESLLRDAQSEGSSGEILDGTSLPLGVVRNFILEEWVVRLDDLVERRLMLLYKSVSDRALRQLAELLVETGQLAAEHMDDEVGRCKARLRSHFGKIVT